MRKEFRSNIAKILTLLFALLCLASCKDVDCICADTFGGSSVSVKSNPDSVYGIYPAQSTDWIETGLRVSGDPLKIAISGAWVPWGMVTTTTDSLASLQSCFDTRNFSPTKTGNLGICAKKVPTGKGALLTGQARVDNINAQNCICYRDETPVGVANVNRDGLTTVAAGPKNSSCDAASNLPDGRNAAEGYCVFHYSLADKMKEFDSVTQDPKVRPPEQQGTVCKFEKGMGLYLGLFGANGDRVPLRLYHLFAQKEDCPIVKSAAGKCEQDSGRKDSNNKAIMLDRTKYIYETSTIPVYDDKSGNNCTDSNPKDDEYHKMREVVKLKIYDSYYRDNYGDYSVEFLSGVYSEDQVPILEYIVNIIEEVLLGKTDSTTGVRDGGILKFLYNSIIGDSDFILIVQILLVLYITFFGLNILLGISEITRKELFTRILQIGIVLFFTDSSGWEMYNTYVVGFFKDGMDDITNKFSMYANTFFLEGETTTNAIRESQLQSGNPDSMGSKFAYIDRVIRDLFSEAATKKIWSLFFYDFFGLLYIIIIYGLIIYFLYVMSIVVFVYCVTLTKMIIALALGPIFFIFILFKQTNEYFKKWLTFISARSLEVVILFLLVFVFVIMIDKKFGELFYYSACIEDWSLWLFKFKFLIATTDASTSSTCSVALTRSMSDWLVKFIDIWLIIYITKNVIMQVPELSGKLVSVGGAANGTGSGSSYATSGFNIGAGIAGKIFDNAKDGASRVAGATAGYTFRGARYALKDTAIGKRIGRGLDRIGRQAIRNKVIDGNIDKASAQADAKGLSGTARDQFIRQQVMSYGKQNGSGGVRGWAGKNKNSAALLNVNTESIAKRLDKKLLKYPMEEMLKQKAKELKSGDAGRILTGKDLAAELEKTAINWAKNNSSLDEQSQFDMIDRMKSRRKFVGGGGWRPRRVNAFDELSKIDYEKASKEKRFGGDDASKEKYLSHLKTRQFEKYLKNSKNQQSYKDGFTAESGKVTKQSKAFIRRADDRKQYNPFGTSRLSNRKDRDEKLKNLEYKAVRNSLMGQEFFDEQDRVRDRFNDENSIERKRAAFNGENYERQLNAKRDREIDDIGRKREYFKESLKGKVIGVARAAYDSLPNNSPERKNIENDLIACRNNILGQYKNKMMGPDAKNIDMRNMAQGLVSVPVNLTLAGKKEFEDGLSLFEVNAMIRDLGVFPAGTKASDALQKEMKDCLKKQQDELKAIEKKGNAQDKTREDMKSKEEEIAAKTQELEAMGVSSQDLQDAIEKLKGGDDSLMKGVRDSLDSGLGPDSDGQKLVDELNAALEQQNVLDKEYAKVQKDIEDGKVIVDGIEVEFGQSVMDALALGGDVGLKGGNVALGGNVDTSNVDSAQRTSAEMNLSQQQYKLKVNKNKMAHLEHEKSSLENQSRNTQDNKKKAEINSKVSGIDSEIATLKNENAMDTSRMNDAQSRMNDLTNG